MQSPLSALMRAARALRYSVLRYSRGDEAAVEWNFERGYPLRRCLRSFLHVISCVLQIEDDAPEALE